MLQLLPLKRHQYILNRGLTLEPLVFSELPICRDSLGTHSLELQLRRPRLRNLGRSMTDMVGEWERNGPSWVWFPVLQDGFLMMRVVITVTVSHPETTAVSAEDQVHLPGPSRTQTLADYR